MDPRELLTVTLVSPTGDTSDVCLDLAADVTWAQVRTAIAEVTGWCPDPAYVGDTLLAPQAPALAIGVRHGSVIAPHPAEISQQHLVSLVVAEGPGAGRSVPIGPQGVVVGRDPACSLTLQSPAVSRRQVLIRVDNGRVTVTDLNATNPAVIDGCRLGAGATVELRFGDRLSIGPNTLILQRDRRTTPRYEGPWISVQQVPRTVPAVTNRRVRVPAAPAEHVRHGLPWLMALAPLAMAIVMVLLWHQMLFLAFALLSPLMILAQYVTDRRSGTRTSRREQTAYEQQVADINEQITEWSRQELDLRRLHAPPPGDLVRAVVHRDRRLWSRQRGHADFLLWRIGRGRVPAAIDVEDRPPTTLSDGPVTIDLQQHRCVGVVCETPWHPVVLGSLALQLAGWHSPRQVRIVGVGAPELSRDLRWLPHWLSCDLETLSSDRTLRAGRDGSSGNELGDHIVVLSVEPASADAADVHAVLRAPKEARMTVVTIASHVSLLPPETSVTVDLADADSATIPGVGPVIPDLLAPAVIRRLTRELAPCRDTSAESGGELPTDVHLHDLLRTTGLDLRDPQSLADLWNRHPRSTIATIGRGADAPLTIDLSSDGPHALVAGTTGAGKSELLQTFVASLAAANRPDELAFVLVDYKGGAAFAECAALPHTVGLVTDLDAHLTRRALRSLDAEIHRRERILSSAGAADLAAYQRISGVPRLARMVLVVDEFRVLAEELPDFVTGLVRIATVGRSLGIHLILATQRPSGVVSPDIRANVNLRIALRVRDDADSHDVIGCSDAARIEVGTPGRALISVGGGSPRPVQTARVTTNSAILPPPAVAWPSGSVRPEPVATAGNDLAALAEAAHRARLTLDAEQAPTPWLPPLPSLMTAPGPACSRRTLSDAESSRSPFAAIDLPELQCISGLSWDPGIDGHLAIVGGPRSGRTTAVRSVIAAACADFGPSDLVVYAVDAGGQLRSVAVLPHCGGVLEADDAAGLQRLAGWLSEECRSRQALLGEHAAAGYDELPPSARVGRPRIMVAIDGWEQLAETSEERTLGRLADEFLAIARAGSAVAVHLLATGGRGLMSGRVAGAFPSRLAFGLPDNGDLVLLGLHRDAIPERLPPGRALVIPEGNEAQVLVIGSSADGPAQAAALAELAESAGERPSCQRRFQDLPEVLSLSEVGGVDGGLPIGVGLGSDGGLGPVAFPAGPGGDPVGFVCGPPGSGRTTALLTLAAGATVAGWVSAGRPPGLPEQVCVLPAHDPATVAAWLAAHPAALVLVDDVDQLTGTAAEEPLLEHLLSSRMSGGGLVAAGCAAELIHLFRGLVPELRRAQTGILLQPGRHDGELLGIRCEGVDRPRPGRGLLAVRGRTSPIHVALPPS